MKLASQPICPSGVPVSDLIAGFWRLRHWGWSPQKLLSFINELLELGVSTVDHAMVYRSEALFGAALSLEPTLREKLQIVTKCGIRPVGFGELGAAATNHYDSSARAIEESVDASLRDLATDYIDILLLHRPDYLMDINEVALTFERLKSSGKVRAFGVSNFSPSQFALLHSVWPELVTNQVEFSPLTQQQLDTGVFDQCQQLGVRPMLWSCLAGGQLLNPTGERGTRVFNVLKQVAKELEADGVEQVVYAWVRSLPCRPVPLLGTSDINRVRLAVESTRLALSRDQWYAIWEAANGQPVP